MVASQVFILCIVCISSSWQKKNDSLLLSFNALINRFDPVTGDIQLLHNASANSGLISNIEFDSKHNCIFFAIQAKDNNKILEKCLDLNQTERTERVIADAVSYDTSLSYDWSSQLLYFLASHYEYTDTIEVIKIVRKKDYSDNGSTRMNYMRRTIVANPKLKCFLCDIVIHPVHKYLFWTSGHLGEPAIRRCNADGSNVKKIVDSEFVSQPIEISIDFDFDRIYWLDSRKHTIGRSDFNGNRIELFQLPDPSFPRTSTALVVTEDRVYWSNEHSAEIYYGNKDIEYDKTSKITLGIHRESLSPLRLVSMTNRSDVQWPVATQCNCSHLCIHSKDGTFKCLCPNGMKQTTAGDCICSFSEEPSPDGTCAEKFNDNFFRCADGPMIQVGNVCNNVTDCSDNSDENGCLNWTCDSNLFQCKSNGKCIQGSLKCDGLTTCPDGSDEMECVSCDDDNSTFGRRCDGIYDCMNKFDEEECDEVKVGMCANPATTDSTKSEET